METGQRFHAVGMASASPLMMQWTATTNRISMYQIAGFVAERCESAYGYFSPYRPCPGHFHSSPTLDIPAPITACWLILSDLRQTAGLMLMARLFRLKIYGNGR